MGLCCSGDLRGLWGFCTRVGLGGFGACGVLAPVFIVLQLFFFFFACFPALLVLFASLVYLCCFCGSLGVGGVAFSLTDYTQKERALRVGASSLRLLPL